MSEKKLIVMVGLPRSGKSTWAKESGHPIVSADAIQHAMCGKQLKPLHAFYDMSDTFAKYMIKSLFLAGHDTVVYDACNHTTGRRRIWKLWCLLNGTEIEFKYIDTDMKTCQERANGFKNADWLVTRINEMEFEFDRLDVIDKHNALAKFAMEGK